VRQPIGRALAWIGTVARLVVGAVWIVAGLLKLPDPAASVRAVRAYQLLPESTVTVIGYGLPILEVCLGLLLVVGLGTRAVAGLSALLFIAYIIGISSAWARGLQIDCGCFGGGGFAANATSKYPGEIARDAGLLALCAFLVVWPRTHVSLDAWLIPAENRGPA
jgi:uncharacterized membrane protein YphA (DoxX/SURF4 family)